MRSTDTIDTVNGRHSTAERLPRFRFVVISVLWITAIFLYFDRVNISMAAPHIMKDLSLSGVQMGLILSMFSWGFIPGQLLGGFVADRIGIRKWAIFWYSVWCLTTFLTGFCRSLVQFVAVRFLFGFSEGTVINQVNKMQNHWAFPAERGFVNGGMMCAAYFGLVIGTPLVAWLISLYGWQGMFFISGAVTVIGVVLFWIFVYDYPRSHPKIPEAERDALEDALKKDRVTYDQSSGDQETLPFVAGLRSLMTSWTYWAMCVSFFFINMIYYTNFSWLPGYLQIERGFTNIGSGAALILPYLSAAIGALSGGIISDKLGNRCLVIIAGALLTIPSIIGLLNLDSQSAVIVTLSLIMFCNASAVSTYVVLLFDIFPPEIVGTGLAVLAGLFGGLGGIAGPMMMGFSLDLTGSFYTGFATLGVGMVISIVLMSFVFFQEKKSRCEKPGTEDGLSSNRDIPVEPTGQIFHNNLSGELNMETIDVAYNLNVPASAVWPYIADFLDIMAWWPANGEVVIERVDVEGEGIGCIRHIYNEGFSHPISERLDYLDADNCQWKLSIVGEKPAGIVEYQATGQLVEIDSSRCRMTYHSEFSAAEGRVEEARNFLTGCYDLMRQGLELAATRRTAI